MVLLELSEAVFSSYNQINKIISIHELQLNRDVLCLLGIDLAKELYRLSFLLGVALASGYNNEKASSKI